MIDLNFWLLAAIAVFDAVVMLVTIPALVLGKDTWKSAPIRWCVFAAACGLGAEAAYTCQVMINKAVPHIFPLWILKDLGIGVLLLLDVFAPHLYWTGESHARKP